MSLSFLCRLSIALALLLIVSSEAVEKVEVKAQPGNTRLERSCCCCCCKPCCCCCCKPCCCCCCKPCCCCCCKPCCCCCKCCCCKCPCCCKPCCVGCSGYGRRRRHHCCTNGAVQQAIVPPNTYSNSPAAFPITILPSAMGPSSTDKQCECSAFNPPASEIGRILPPMPSPQPIPAQSAEPAKETEPKSGCECGCCDCGCCDCGCCGCMAARKAVPVAAASPSVTGTVKSCGCESPEPSADDISADGGAAKDVDTVQKQKVFRRLRSKPIGKLHSLIKRTQSTGKYSQSLLHRKPIVRHKIIV